MAPERTVFSVGAIHIPNAEPKGDGLGAIVKRWVSAGKTLRGPEDADLEQVLRHDCLSLLAVATYALAWDKAETPEHTQALKDACKRLKSLRGWQ